MQTVACNSEVLSLQASKRHGVLGAGVLEESKVQVAGQK